MASFIRGLTVETVERNLTARSFVCEDYLGGPGPGGRKATRLCKSFLAIEGEREAVVTWTVTYAATDAGAVEWLRAAATMPTPEIAGETVKPHRFARDVLAFIATYAYAGAIPARARAWVEKNIDNDGASIVIGAARLSIEARADERVTVLKLDPA